MKPLTPLLFAVCAGLAFGTEDSNKKSSSAPPQSFMTFAVSLPKASDRVDGQFPSDALKKYALALYGKLEPEHRAEKITTYVRFEKDKSGIEYAIVRVAEDVGMPI